MATTYLSRTNGTPTNAKKFTWSAWFKKTTGAMNVAGNKYDASNYAYFYFRGTDDLRFFDRSGGVDTIWVSDRVFRDASAWYNLVISVDTTQSTDTNRFKVYVNGVQDTGNGITYPALNADMAFNKATASGLARIGTNQDTGSFFNGSMSHVHFTDGYTYDASAFGSTDATTGEWKINTSPSVTYGNNGFTILKDGNTITDQSANSNDFTLGAGTLTNTEDCPSDNFATFNSLCKTYSGYLVESNGNTTITNTQDWTNMPINMGVSSGKYYWEVKIDNVSSNVFVGVCGDGYVSDGYDLYNDPTPYDQNTGLALYFTTGRKTVNGTDTEGYYQSYATGDIVGVALDLDASTKTVTYYKNGTVEPAGATDLPTNMQTGFVFGICMVNAASSASKVSINMGTGNFGTTAISSEGTNASGIGKFEYDVPSGYTALSTKGLNI